MSMKCAPQRHHAREQDASGLQHPATRLDGVVPPLKDVTQGTTIRDDDIETSVGQSCEIADVQLLVGLDAVRKTVFGSIATIESELHIRDVRDHDAAAEAMERLREPPGASADFEHTRSARNEALEIEIMDVFVNRAQRVLIEALPFSVSQLIEVGRDCGAIVGHQVPERSTLVRRIPRPFQKSGG